MDLLGCVADDFTGATDVASVLAGVGRRVLVVFDVDRVDPHDLYGVDAVIVALKSRTAPVADAVRQSLVATAWLRDRGAARFYFKYCSTFDSTPEGNIGPVIDAMMRELGARVALVAPSYPANERTVYQGHLFVNHTLLEHSTMRDHPLTPMRNSRLETLLRPQTALPIGHLYLPDLRRRPEAVRALLTGEEASEPRIVIADAIGEEDLVTLVHAADARTLLTGGAGLALGLEGNSPVASGKDTGLPEGGRLIACGSASATSRAQIAHARKTMESIQLDLSRALADTDSYVRELVGWVRDRWAEDPSAPAMVYATGYPADVAEPADRRRVAEAIEATLGRLSAGCLEHGLAALLVAGGETSGRIVQELHIASLQVTRPLAPGVSWARATTQGRPIALALKSGNFGGIDLFTQAWKDCA